MTPGAIVEVVSGPWQGRVGVVEPIDPEWAGVPYGSLLVRLRSGCAGRPQAERVVVLAGDVMPVELRVLELKGRAGQ